ncbi:hypothetical protein JCM10908_007109 [Rhodotorula pacifica]|uniref:uncharacterized protein n=1 Tax=Rhodotorula pacifica TaxID=1495444 RepID=UPI0031725BC1
MRNAASLSSLPDDVKTRIASHLHEPFNPRVYEPYQSSLKDLALVNREWLKICTPFAAEHFTITPATVQARVESWTPPERESGSEAEETEDRLWPRPMPGPHTRSLAITLDSKLTEPAAQAMFEVLFACGRDLEMLVLTLSGSKYLEEEVTMPFTDALRDILDLETLEIRYNTENPNHVQIARIVLYYTCWPLVAMGNLRNLIILDKPAKRNPGTRGGFLVEDLARWITACSSIESFHTDLYLSASFQQLQWPNLKSFTHHPFRYEKDNSNLSTFFFNHQDSLVSLDLSHHSFEPLVDRILLADLDGGPFLTLSRLRHLHIGTNNRSFELFYRFFPDSCPVETLHINDDENLDGWGSGSQGGGIKDLTPLVRFVQRQQPYRLVRIQVKVLAAANAGAGGGGGVAQSQSVGVNELQTECANRGTVLILRA